MLLCVDGVAVVAAAAAAVEFLFCYLGYVWVREKFLLGEVGGGGWMDRL